MSGKVWKSKSRSLAGRKKQKQVCLCSAGSPFPLDSTGVPSHWAGADHAQGVSALFCQSSGDAVPDMPTSPLTSQSSG